MTLQERMLSCSIQNWKLQFSTLFPNSALKGRQRLTLTFENCYFLSATVRLTKMTSLTFIKEAQKWFNILHTADKLMNSFGNFIGVVLEYTQLTL